MASGAMTESAGEGNVNYTKRIAEGFASRREKLWWDLNQLNPTAYPVSGFLPRKTVARFGTLTL